MTHRGNARTSITYSMLGRRSQYVRITGHRSLIEYVRITGHRGNARDVDHL